MTYKVIKQEVQAIDERGVHDFKVDRYYAFFGKQPNTSGRFSDPYIEVWKDGSLTLHHRGKCIFLYDDQWDGIIKAVQMAKADKKAERERSYKKSLDETMDALEYWGIQVDFSRRQVIDMLKTCEIKIHNHGSYTSPSIIYNGIEYGLCRTDLKDNVATGCCENRPARSWRQHFMKKAMTCMGARINEYSPNRRSIAIIDSFSDG